METRVTKLLGIEYPIIQGGMAWVANANLAANVSKAGGIGFIGAANAPGEWVRSEIRKAREITDKPVGVNIMLLSEHRLLLKRKYLLYQQEQEIPENT